MPKLSSVQLVDLEINSKLAEKEYLGRKLSIEERTRYADGDQKKWLIDPTTKIALEENVTVNVSGKVIDQTVSFLVGTSPIITTGNEAIDAIIKEITDANLDDVFYHNLVESGSIAGHAFVKISPDEERRVRWMMQAPELVSVFWRPADSTRAIGYKIQWTEDETDYRQDILQVSPTQWVVCDLTRPKNGHWQRVNDDVIWNYPFAPMIDWQNLPNSKSYYGRPDLKALKLNDAINFTASNVNLILKFHAHPRTVATGISPDQLNATSVDGLWAIENPEAKIANLEMTSDLSSSMNYLEFERAEFFSEHRAIDISSMKDKIGSLTNFGLRMLFMEALAKNNTKQLLYGYGLKELVYRSLRILNIAIDREQIVVKFADPLPVNKTEIATAARTELEAGFISAQTGSESLGHNWEEEKRRKAAEKQDSQGNLGKDILDLIRPQDGGFE